MKLLYTLLLFQDVSGGELILVLLVIFMLFGPKKVPEIAKGLAKGLYKIKKATDSIRDEVNEVMDPLKQELQNQEDLVKKEMEMEKEAPSKEKQDKSDTTPAG